MGRGRGGNKSGRPLYNKRQAIAGNRTPRNEREFQELLNDGFHDAERSYFSESGGFVVTHVDHNRVSNPEIDLEPLAARILADYGYRVYLDSERSYIENQRTPDGRLNRRTMDIKTINTSGSNTVRSKVDKASGQGVEVVVLMENCRGFSDAYVRGQIQKFRATRHAESRIKEVFWVKKDGSTKSMKI